MMIALQQKIKDHFFIPSVLTSKTQSPRPSKFHICLWVLCEFLALQLLKNDDNLVHFMFPYSTFQFPTSSPP